MLECDRVDISEGIDINKTNKSQECMFCHYWYFLNKDFSSGLYLCDGCYNIVQRSADFKNIAIAHIKESAYRIYFLCMSKHELITKYHLTDKTGSINCND